MMSTALRVSLPTSLLALSCFAASIGLAQHTRLTTTGLSGSTVVSPDDIASPRNADPDRDVLDRTIALRLNDATIEDALRAISRQTSMGLAFSRDILPANRRVNIDVKSISVGEALQLILRDTKLRASVSGSGRITIVPVTAQKQAGKGIIAGTVTNANTKRIVEGVHIALDGTQITIRTNEEGKYVLRDVPAGIYTITARGVGYAKRTRQVEVKDGETTTIDFQLEESVNTLNEMVVTSTVAESRIKSVPVDVTVITADQIARKNITRIEQLFRGDIPGLFANDEGYLSLNPRDVRTPYVRGQNFLSASTSSTPSFLKTYIDGVLVTDYGVVSQLDPASIERIEVVRGPAASTMYGSGASDGVMQIFTKRGRGAQKLRVTMGLSANLFDSPYKGDKVASPRVSLSVTGGGEAFSYNASAFASKQGAWVPNYKNTTRGLNGGVQWSSGPLTMNATIGYIGPGRFNNPALPWLALGIREGVLSRARVPESALMPTHDFTNSNSQIGGVDAQYHVTPNWNHTLRLGTNITSTETVQESPRYAYIGDTLLSMSTGNSRTNTIFYSNTWRHEFGNNVQATLTTGFEHTSNWNSFTSIGNLTVPRGGIFGSVFGSRDATRNTGYFGQWEVGFRDMLFLTAGSRIEHNPDFGDDVKYQTAPRVGLAYVHEFPSNISLKSRVSYGWGTRPPLAYQKEGKATSQYVSGNILYEDIYLPNERLLASRNTGVDYGIDVFFGNFVSLSVTAYNQFASRDVYQTNVRTDTSTLPEGAEAQYKVSNQHRFLNVGEVQSKGVEIAASAQWNSWSLTSTYSTTSNIIRSMPKDQALAATYSSLEVGDRFPWIPTYTGATTLGYANQFMSANLQVTYQGRVRAADQLDAFNRLYGVASQDGPARPGREIILPHWAKYHLNVTQQLTNNLSVLTSIQNLNNRRVTEGLDTQNPYAGRQILVGLRVNN